MKTRKHPSGRVLGFQDRFVLRVRSGAKRHTIRAGDLWRVGMTAHLYEKSRQPGMALIFRSPVVKVEEVVISKTWTPRFQVQVEIEGLLIGPDECAQLARADGFDNFTEMVAFWEKRLLKCGAEGWYGQLIHWDYEQRSTAALPKRKARKAA